MAEESLAMRCPLCAGPLHLDEVGLYACVRGHRLDADELQRQAAARVTVAFWMAIEALETEAQALRSLGSDLENGQNFARAAEEDAAVLRHLAMSRMRSTGDGTGELPDVR